MPLFSAASTSSWGIGEFQDIGPLAEWIATCGCDRLMILPIGAMAPGQTSPYSAASAMALDPIYIAVDAVTDFVQAGGVTALPEDLRTDLAGARASRHVQYTIVRRAKDHALDLAFAQFAGQEWEQHTPRAAAFAAYIARERWWLDDYALFQALSDAHGAASWREWPAPLRDRDPQAIDAARRHLARPILRQQYLQWIAEDQWQSARSAADAHGVAVFGDLPFVVNLHSADVWARADEFLLDVSVGVPPDAFSDTGQDWGLPAYRWDLIAARDYPWIRQRARRMSSLFSGFRVDHVIGFYRTYGRPPEGEPFFSPPGEASQTRQGETILQIFQDTGAAIIAEDLGTVPDFLRASLARLGVAGCKVLRWERRWIEPGRPFVSPADYPPSSCAMTGTHDTDTLSDWWSGAASEERTQVLRLPFLRNLPLGPASPWSEALRDALLELACSAASQDVFIAVQDLFGWNDRINVPGTVGDHNWTWRMPWPVDRLSRTPEASTRAAFLQTLAGGRRRVQCGS
jgi:4-alpha-glucanotransferase